MANKKQEKQVLIRQLISISDVKRIEKMTQHSIFSKKFE